MCFKFQTTHLGHNLFFLQVTEWHNKWASVKCCKRQWTRTWPLNPDIKGIPSSRAAHVMILFLFFYLSTSIHSTIIYPTPAVSQQQRPALGILRWTSWVPTFSSGYPPRRDDSGSRSTKRQRRAPRGTVKLHEEDNARLRQKRWRSVGSGVILKHGAQHRKTDNKAQVPHGTTGHLPCGPCP